MKKSIRFAAFTAFIAVSTITSQADASLIIDLRFAGGGKTLNINSGTLTPITINAWAMVTGVPGNAAEEGMQSARIALKSSITTSGITGNITGAAVSAGWNGGGASIGTSSNLSADGIGDWGSVANAGIGANLSVYFRARTTKTVNNPVDWGDFDSAGVYSNLPDGGVEFLIGAFTFTPNSAALGGVLKYIPVVPTGGLNAPAGWFEDTTDKTSDLPNGGRNPSTAGSVYGPGTPNTAGINGVTINVIPEPVSLGLIGLATMCATRRRR